MRSREGRSPARPCCRYVSSKFALGYHRSLIRPHLEPLRVGTPRTTYPPIQYPPCPAYPPRSNSMEKNSKKREKSRCHENSLNRPREPERGGARPSSSVRVRLESAQPVYQVTASQSMSFFCKEEGGENGSSAELTVFRYFSGFHTRSLSTAKRHRVRSSH